MKCLFQFFSTQFSAFHGHKKLSFLFSVAASFNTFNGDELNWNVIWSNVFNASENPNHQYIHLKFCHQAYNSPRIREIGRNFKNVVTTE